MNPIESSSEADRIHFAVLAIEAAAKKMGITPSEMRRRLKKQELIKKRLFKFYDTLYTQSIAWISDDIVEVLYNWEATDVATTAQKGGIV